MSYEELLGRKYRGNTDLLLHPSQRMDIQVFLANKETVLDQVNILAGGPSYTRPFTLIGYEARDGCNFQDAIIYANNVNWEHPITQEKFKSCLDRLQSVEITRNYGNLICRSITIVL